MKIVYSSSLLSSALFWDRDDQFEAHNASKHCKYYITNLKDIRGDQYKIAHGGYDSIHANDDPDRVLPLLNEGYLLEEEGAFGKLYDYYYVTVGNVTAVFSAV